jgi:hypothetical protein
VYIKNNYKKAMRIVNEVVTALEVKNVAGISKTNEKAYSFWTFIFGDDELNRITCTIGKEIADDEVAYLKDWAERKSKIVVDLELTPKPGGFGTNLRLVGVRAG